MKQYLSSEQTAKLIELGFKKPESIIDAWAHETDIDIEYVYEYAYSIGELIEILPQTINVFYDLSIMSSHKGWCVLYGMIGDGDMWSIEHEVYRNDLIDALYDMIVKLKEEGVI
jgi:hypothetical protein